MSFDFDFVVAGGGPAGLGVAIEAARRGARVCVVERASFPVDKACGEGLMPGGVARLRALGVTFGVKAAPFAGIRFRDEDVTVAAAFAGGNGLGVMRTVLSAALLDRAVAAGATVEEHTRVETWEPVRGGVRVLTSAGVRTGRWLVGADGLHSRVRAEAGIAAHPGGRPRWGARRHFRVTTAEPWVDVHWGKTGEAYVTPCGGDVVGVALLWEGGPRRYDALLEGFPRLAARLGEPVGGVRGAGPFDWRVGRPARGRVLLAGDAAGFVDALTGEGVSLALAGAEALVTAALSGQPWRYVSAWRRIRARHVVATRVLLALTRPPEVRFRVLRALAAAPAAFAAMVRFAAGEEGWLGAAGALGQVVVGAQG